MWCLRRKPKPADLITEFEDSVWDIVVTSLREHPEEWTWRYGSKLVLENKTRKLLIWCGNDYKSVAVATNDNCHPAGNVSAHPSEVPPERWQLQIRAATDALKDGAQTKLGHLETIMRRYA